MHPVVLDKPYRFFPPYSGTLWPRVLAWVGSRRLSREFGIEAVKVQGVQHLQQSLRARHGVLLAPNHCRPSDPFVVGETCRQAGTLPLVMASWHLFMQGRLKAFLLRRAGAFSIYREGVDRQALAAGVEILTRAERPLVVFPEGVISRHNDRLNSMMDGTSFLGRTAAKKRADSNPPGQVVIHPVAIRYHFLGDVAHALHVALDDIEQRLSWRPRRDVPLIDRIVCVGESLLCLKELECLGKTQDGSIFERVERLIDHLLAPLEQEWLKGRRESTTVARVKQLRVAILPDMVQEKVTATERERRWRQLADMYLAQQMSCYPRDYLGDGATPERLIETVERFEEDLTDSCRVYRPMTATVQIGEAINVPSARERGATEDPVMSQLERQLSNMLGIRSVD